MRRFYAPVAVLVLIVVLTTPPAVLAADALQREKVGESGRRSEVEPPSAEGIVSRSGVDVDDPSTPIAELLEVAEELIGSGYPADGAELVDIVLDRDEEHPRARFVRGWAFHEQGRSDDALQWYLKAEEAGEGSAALQFNIGVIRYHQGFFELALRRARGAYEISPQFMMAWQLEGEAHLSLGSYREAELAFTTRIALSPGEATGYFYRGYTRLQSGEYSGAIADLDHAISIDSANPWSYLYRAEAETLLGDTETALATLAVARHRDAPEVAVLSREADAYLEAGCYTQAVSAIQDAIDLQPKNADLVYKLGKIHEDLGYPAEALPVFRRVIALAPEEPAAYNRIGYLLNGMNRFGQAVGSLERAIELAPEWSWPINNLANAVKNLGDIERALRLYRRALHVDPDYYVAAANLARAYYYDLDDVDNAVVAINRAVELNPDSVGTLTFRAEILADTGRDPRQARADLRRALEIYPRSENALNQLSELDYDEGRYRAAVETLTRAREIVPDEQWVVVRLAETLRNLGWLDAADRELSAIEPAKQWHDEIDRVTTAIETVQPLFAGRVDPAAPGEVVELQRLHGAVVASVATTDTGEFAIPVRELTGDSDADTWFADALESKFVIRVRSGSGDEWLYERTIDGRALTRYHLIELR